MVILVSFGTVKGRGKGQFVDHGLEHNGSVEKYRIAEDQKVLLKNL